MNIFPENKLLIATHNTGKLEEFKYLLKDCGMTISGAKKVLNLNKSLKLDEFSNDSINAGYNIRNKIKNISNLVKQIKELK